MEGSINFIYLGHHRGRNGAPRPPKMPERPIAPYVRYTQKVWDTVKQSNPDMKMWELSRQISKMWREAAESERQLYFEEFEQGSCSNKSKIIINKQYFSKRAYNEHGNSKSWLSRTNEQLLPNITVSKLPSSQAAMGPGRAARRRRHALLYGAGWRHSNGR